VKLPPVPDTVTVYEPVVTGALSENVLLLEPCATTLPDASVTVIDMVVPRETVTVAVSVPVPALTL